VKMYYLCFMKEMINKFLDEYLGDEVVCIKGRSTKKYNHYSLYSKKNKTLILFFSHNSNEGNIAMFRGDRLTNTVSNFFSMNDDDVSPIIRDWFGDKHNLNKVGDLIKFVN
jgi:hypothetical protein